MSKKDKKEILFNLFSNNLSGIFENVKNRHAFPQEFGCYCPICETHHTKENLHKLSLEHNPPNSLGGKDNILTCIKCNSIAGSKIDSEILLALQEFDLMNFKPNANLKTRFTNKSTGETAVNGNLQIDEEGKFIINIGSGNNPKVKDAFLNSFEYSYVAHDVLLNNLEDSGVTRKIEFQFPKPNRRNERLASISLLKIAYLIGFENWVMHLYLVNI